jgi:hypothetical protein
MSQLAAEKGFLPHAIPANGVNDLLPFESRLGV